MSGSQTRQTAGITQFSRALSELDIDIVCANSPQAKGRVERAHLTLQDRVLYLVEPGPETLRLAGEICRVHEVADGGIEIFHAERLLPSRALFDENPHVSQGAIVANKRLGAVLAKIQADQQERDRERLGRGLKAVRAPGD